MHVRFEIINEAIDVVAIDDVMVTKPILHPIGCILIDVCLQKVSNRHQIIIIIRKRPLFNNISSESVCRPKPSLTHVTGGSRKLCASEICVCSYHSENRLRVRVA